MMVEYLKHEGNSHSFGDLLKICVKMRASVGETRKGI